MFAPSTNLLSQLAPTFALKNQTGHIISLDQFRDKKCVVLIFYPGDMTPGCTMQLCAIRDDWSKFQKADTVVLGINHAGADSHTLFLKTHGLPFPLLTDKNKKVSAQYGATFSLLGRSIIRRTVVCINRDGIVIYYKHGMPKNADILKSLHAPSKHLSQTV